MTGARRGGSGRPFAPRFVVPLLWSTSLNPINSSILATSLVAIASAFQVTAGQTASLVAAVYVASAVGQPAMGKLADAFGARRVLMTGLAIVTLGGVVGACAPAFGWLIVSRALIGLGTAAGYPTAMAMIRARADEAGTGLPGGVLGGISIAGQATAALGLPIGGALVGLWGWPAVFAINIPLGVIGILLVLRGVPADPPRRSESAHATFGALDPVGMALFAAAVVTLIAVLSDIRSPAWWLIAAFAASVALLILWELRARSPFIDVRMLARNGPLLRTYLRQALMLMSAYAVLYGYVQWLEEGRGLPASVSGLVMLPMSVVAAVGAAVISRRALIRGPLIVSCLALIAGGTGIAFVDDSTNAVLLVGLSLVFGVVLGMTSTSNQAALYTQTSADDIAVASGLSRTASYLGAIFASALITLAFPGHATDGGMHAIAWVIVGTGVLVLALVLIDRKVPRSGN